MAARSLDISNCWTIRSGFRVGADPAWVAAAI